MQPVTLKPFMSPSCVGICVASYVHGIPSWDGVGLETVRFPPYDRGLEPSNHTDLLISLSIRQIDISPKKSLSPLSRLPEQV